MTSRRGASSLGCLFSLLIVTAAVYFGVNVAEVYWRFYQYQDDMRQFVRFNPNTPQKCDGMRIDPAPSLP